MGLFDHFHAPLGLRRNWQGLYSAWIVYIAAALNSSLADEYFAEAHVYFGNGPFAFESAPLLPTSNGIESWVAPPPARTVPITLLEDVAEVLVYLQEGGPNLAGAIELVSPANKDRPAHREAFISKCAAYLQQGVGLVIVDIVTERPADLHGELLSRLGSSEAAQSAPLYSAAYRVVRGSDRPELEVWWEPVYVGGELPLMPLSLRGGVTVPVDLPATYARTCTEQRIVS